MRALPYGLPAKSRRAASHANLVMVTMRVLTGAVLAMTFICGSALAADDGDSFPLKPSLTPQRLHRLRLEKDRQTTRWADFENRVQTVPDSPERGFELALYYAVAQDEQRGRDAVAWAAAHPDKTRQRAIVADWCANLVSDEQRKQWSAAGASAVPVVTTFAGASPNELAALLLLSRTPAELEHPSWQAHVRALALVTEHPNLPNSQFLQSWVLQSDQMIREGPGVGYEFFWADPYLPGVSYQNMEPWIYASGSLFARTDWTKHACWVSVSTTGVKEQGCPEDWRSKPMNFGHLTLIPLQQRCMDVTQARNNTAFLLWNLQPGQKMTYRYQKKQVPIQADAAGLLRLPSTLEGKVCVAR